MRSLTAVVLPPAAGGRQQSLPFHRLCCNGCFFFVVCRLVLRRSVPRFTARACVGASQAVSLKHADACFRCCHSLAGSGIYRHMTLNTAPKAFLVPWSLYAPSVVTGAIQGDLSGPQTASQALVSLNADIQVSAVPRRTWPHDNHQAAHDIARLC